MKLLPNLLILVLTLTALTVHADTGEKLHQSACIDCHSRMTGGDGHVIYTRDERIAKDIEELNSRVTHCANGANTGWDSNQINSVTEYLNTQYYQY